MVRVYLQDGVNVLTGQFMKGTTMKFETISFEDLTPEQASEVSGNGAGKEYATYIKATHLGKVLWIQSDAMESEDATFGRDLSWIRSALNQAYNIGLGTDN